jgi:C4-type Zn-finger protein
MEVIESFAEEIEKLKKVKGINYIDAVILFCENHGYEVESIAMLVKKDPVLISKIKNEAELSNLLKNSKRSRLPI